MDYQSIFERVESKYILTGKQYEALMEKIHDRIQPDMYPHSNISSVYFDTDDYQLVRGALAGNEYREKLRLRSYGLKDDNSEVFLELKKKYLGVTYKRRQALSYRDAMNYLLFGNKTCSSQIMKEIDYLFSKHEDLKPKALIRYQRDCFVSSRDPSVRITFDYDISYSLKNLLLKNNEPEEKLTDADTIIMEIKCLNSMELWLASRLDELSIYPGNFSKYGQIYTNRIMKGVKTCLNSYSHQYIHQPSHLRYSSSVQLHQSF